MLINVLLPGQIYFLYFSAGIIFEKIDMYYSTKIFFMKWKIKLLPAILFTGLLATGCNNNDTATSTETVNDSSMVTTAMDTNTMIATPDTTSMMARDTMATAMPNDNMSAKSGGAGMAKPNAAKKGKKGKVMISEPKKSTAKAEVKMDDNGVYNNTEVMPQFIGGYSGMQRYFDNTLTYPDEATNAGVEGTVMVSFMVDENGKLISPTVMGNKMGYGLEEEALRVIKGMPAWTAGTVNGKKVKTRFTLPVRFELQ